MRVHLVGADRIHPDPLTGMVHAHASRQRGERRLGCTIECVIRTWCNPTPARGNIDDRTAACAGHDRNCGAAYPEGCFDVYAHRMRPVRIRGLCHRTPGDHAGIVNDDIQPAQRLTGRRRQSVRKVSVQQVSAKAGFRRDSLDIAISCGDPGALGAKLSRDRSAYSACSARHKHGLSGKPRHRQAAGSPSTDAPIRPKTWCRDAERFRKAACHRIPLGTSIRNRPHRFIV